MHARVDNRARVSVRQCFYSVPARYAGRRLLVRLAARTVEICDGPEWWPATSGPLDATSRSCAWITIWRSLQDQTRALPERRPWARAKTRGVFTGSHQTYWDAARIARGDAKGTRALITVLLAHRNLPAAALITAMDRAVTSGCLDPEAVIIDARREATPGPPSPRSAHWPATTGQHLAERLRRTIDRERFMTTTTKPATADAAAQASIGAAPVSCTCPQCAPKQPDWPRSPTGNAKPICATSLRSWPPRSTTAPNGAAPGASAMPSSPD